MIIECPNCKKKFELPSNLIPERGRLLQCSACSTKWHFKTEVITTVEEKEPEEVIKKTEFPREKDKKIDIKETPVNKKKVKKNRISFLNFLLVFIITATAFIIVLDTFQNSINQLIPGFAFFLDSFYETMNDIILFIKDLVR